MAAPHIIRDLGRSDYNRYLPSGAVSFWAPVWYSIRRSVMGIYAQSCPQQTRAPLNERNRDLSQIETNRLPVGASNLLAELNLQPLAGGPPLRSMGLRHRLARAKSWMALFWRIETSRSECKRLVSTVVAFPTSVLKNPDRITAGRGIAESLASDALLAQSGR